MFIECKVIGKQRPRFRHVKGYVQTYTPAPTKNLEKTISEAWVGECYTTPVKVFVKAVFEPPKSISNKKRKELIENKSHTKKPDIDNIVKLVLDGLNGVAFEDDKQVVELLAKKEYGEVEGLEIEVWKEVL